MRAEEYAQNIKMITSLSMCAYEIMHACMNLSLAWQHPQQTPLLLLSILLHCHSKTNT